jgi:hypothetical protein
MSDEQIKALQAELAALRSRAEKRSFKQVLKDGYDKVNRIMRDGPYYATAEELTIMLSVMVSIILLTVFSVVALIFFAVQTNGLALLLLPVYPLYLIFKKE